MKRCFLLQALACLLVMSCSINELEQKTFLSGDDVFFASLESYSDPDTRVYVDENIKILWDKDDRISIFNMITYNQEYRFAGETGDNSGAFKKVPNDDFVTGNEMDFICAIYPYLESTRISNKGVLSLTLPAEQVYREDSFGPGANTMISSTEDNLLKFKNVGGYLVLKFYGDGVSVSSIKLEGNNGEKLSGAATVKPAVGVIPNITMASTAGSSITITCDEPVELGATKEEATQFWMVVPPTKFSQGFKLTVTDPDGNEFVKETSANLSIARNGVLRISAINVPLGKATDLSANGTANSYIIPSAGLFKLKADVKGNSTKALDGTPTTAEVLWESFNTDVLPTAGDIVKNVLYKDGYLFFEATGKAGNALVAVKDENNTILWSWHLWATNYNPEVEFDVYSGSNAEMMNRNLGALSKTPGDALANGLLYQWGRKDPFLGSSSINQSITSAAIPEGTANQLVYKTEESGTMEYTIQHPTHFINVYNDNWMNIPDYSLWTTTKTEFDPCPPGWRVPSASVYASWQIVEYDYQNYGVTFGSGYSSPATWYPFSGQIYGELCDVGDRFDHWTVTTDGSSAVSPHAGPDYFNLTSYYDGAGFGQSVRCVRETYQEPIPNGPIPLNQIWYTSTDGEIINPSEGTVFYNESGEPLTFTNRWINDKWVLEFSDDVAYWRGSWFHNYPGGMNNRLESLGLPASIQGGLFAGLDQEELFYAAGLNPGIQRFYGEYGGIADDGHLLLIGEDYSIVLGCANSFTGTITVPEGVTAIHHYGFHYSRMSKLILPSTITKLDIYCLEDCSLLTDIYCYATDCPETSNSIWTYVHTSGTLHYPIGSEYSSFNLPRGWTRTGDIMEGYEWITLSEDVLGSTHSGNDYNRVLDEKFYFAKLRVDTSVPDALVWVCMTFLSDANPDFAAFWSQYVKTEVEYCYTGMNSNWGLNIDDDHPSQYLYGTEISDNIIEFDFTSLALKTYISSYQKNVDLSGVQVLVKK